MRLGVALLLLATLALGLRALRFSEVFPGDGSVDLILADSAYHARRALYGLMNFPSVLFFDPYIAYPDGARVPWPPLYDWAVALLAWVLGAGEAGFERVAAWISPALAALTVIPVYAVGRAVGGRGVGLASALVFAVLPAHARRSLLGDLDHHAAVSLLGAAWLALTVELVRAELSCRRLTQITVVMLLVRVAVVLSWGGSLLYLGVAEGTLLLVGVLEGRRRALVGQAVGALGAALVVAGWLASAGLPGDPFLTTDLSWFHVVAFAAVGVIAGTLVWIAPWTRDSLARRVGLSVSVATLVVGAVLTLLPALREALDPALAFMAKTDSYGSRNAEQRPIFSGSGWWPLARITPLGASNYGWLAYAIPLGWLAALARIRDPNVRGPAICLACWSGVSGLLALGQVRFAGEFAPSGSVALALLFAEVARGFSRVMPRLPSRVVSGALVAALLWPALVSTYGHFVIQIFTSPGANSRSTRLSPPRSVTHFARMVRKATPEISGYFDASIRPEYSVLCLPRFGHSIHYWGRRATPADNFGPYLDREKYDAVLRFYLSYSETEAVEIAEGLGVRYVMTHAREVPQHPPFFADRLHASEGGSERFRLVVEGPEGGTPRPSDFPSGGYPAGTVPYKLFELVARDVQKSAGLRTSRTDVTFFALDTTCSDPFRFMDHQSGRLLNSRRERGR